METITEAACALTLAMAADCQHLGRVLTPSVQRDILSEVYIKTERCEAMRRRDDALKRAFCALGNNPSASLLLDALRRFETEKWPLWKWRSLPPDHTDQFQRALFEACQAASAMPSSDNTPGLPTSKRHLNRILAGT
jgi:hypothetical protein